MLCILQAEHTTKSFRLGKKGDVYLLDLLDAGFALEEAVDKVQPTFCCLEMDKQQTAEVAKALVQTVAGPFRLPSYFVYSLHV